MIFILYIYILLCIIISNSEQKSELIAKVAEKLEL